ncbi:hypothetical protein CRE_09487 [Caenorhabditis remanei]|uniref:Uncharacterized protein n=1 Tax=Caenorhabditis remanei TaxID=31234 RepID=E3MJ43_CAERE|nr:hypothetical protein CRE_09487 [Caenorhabditis remanei]
MCIMCVVIPLLIIFLVFVVTTWMMFPGSKPSTSERLCRPVLAIAIDEDGDHSIKVFSLEDTGDSIFDMDPVTLNFLLKLKRGNEKNSETIESRTTIPTH